MTFSPYFASRFIQFLSTVAKVENVSTNRRLGRPCLFLVDDFEILLPCKFCLIQFSGCGGEVNNILANQKSERSSWLSKLGRKIKLRGVTVSICFRSQFLEIHSEVEHLSPSEARALTLVL